MPRDLPARLGRASLVFSVLVVSACVSDVPSNVAPSNADGGGDDAGPGTDAGVSADGAPVVGACDTPGVVSCNGSGARVLTCGPDKMLTSVICGFGCAADAMGAHCKRLQPTGATSTVDYGVATADVDLTAATVFNTDTGLVTGGFARAAGAGLVVGVGYQQIMQTGGPAIGVFSLHSLRVGSGTLVTFVGTRAASLLIEQSLTLDGTISVRGTCATNLPGVGGYAGSTANLSGVVPGLGPQGGGGGTKGDLTSTGNFAMCGGGGAGGRNVGGSGGEGGSNFNGSSSVISKCIPALGGPLAMPFIVSGLIIGGSGGGAGYSGGGTLNGGRGGAGGGAIQISVNGPVSIGGAIDAGGCGGDRAEHTPGPRVGAGGGGAGGLIVIEGLTIDVKVGGTLVANGGSGGGGATNTTAGATAGVQATTTEAAAPGGTGAVCPNGGNGGAKGGAAAVSVVGTCDRPFAELSPVTSGGGGSTGRIALKTVSGVAAVAAGAIVSPVFESATASAK